MNQLSFLQLRDVSDKLVLLNDICRIPPMTFRAKQIRQADKYILSISHFFSPELGAEAKRWSEAYEGLGVLKKTLHHMTKKQKEIEALELRVNELRQEVKPWTLLDDAERQRIVHQAQKAKNFVDKNLQETESHVLHRYKRFSALKELSPYADNANYLCEAVFHYENRDKYEVSIDKIEQKNVHFLESLKTVKRGFWFALVLCVFVVTIPICFPFAISLWKRKKSIEEQIENGEESLRRERKRLLAAEEGAAIAQEIRAHLGEMSLEQIRDTLTEVRDLRAEFRGPERTSSSTAVLLSFLDLYRNKLIELFGEMPEDPVEAFRWLVVHVEKQKSSESLIKELEENKISLLEQKEQMTRGYTQDVLVQGIERLEEIVKTNVDLPFQNTTKVLFASLCLSLTSLLNEMRDLLSFISKNLPVDIERWQELCLQLQDLSYSLSLCVLDVEVEVKQQA